MKKNRVKGSLASILSLAPSWIIYCEEKTSGCVVRPTPGEEQVSELGFRSSKACHLPHNPPDRSSSLNQFNEKTALDGGLASLPKQPEPEPPSEATSSVFSHRSLDKTLFSLPT